MMTRERDLVTWGCLLAVGGAAVVLSFSALSDLARLCGVKGTIGSFQLAWLLPVVIDVFAIAATRIWLRKTVHPDAVDFARRAMWAAVITTIASNAYHGGLASSAPWLARIDDIVIGALPAIAVCGLVHLAVLAAQPWRPPSDPDASTVEKAPETPAETSVTGSALVLAGGTLSGLTPELVAQARELMKREPGIGRPRLARELGISEYAARGLLSVLAPTNGHPGGGGS